MYSYDFPTKPGGTVYVIDSVQLEILPIIVDYFEIFENQSYIIFKNYPFAYKEEFGVKFFTTREDAEAAKAKLI